jgi:hypothetical protein
LHEVARNPGRGAAVRVEGLDEEPARALMRIHHARPVSGIVRDEVRPDSALRWSGTHLSDARNAS